MIPLPQAQQSAAPQPQYNLTEPQNTQASQPSATSATQSAVPANQ
jgi:hypothetical protein